MTKITPPTPHSLTILTSSHVSSVLSTLDPLIALETQTRVFRSFSAQHHHDASAKDGEVPSVQAPQRIVTTTPHQSMLFMPSRAAEAGGSAIKIVSVPSNGGAEGLPATTLVMDERNGRVKGVVNARKLTAVRNACGSALSYRTLHPDGKPESLVVFGSGAQADAHIRLFIRLYPSLRTVTLIARRPTPRSAALMTSLDHNFSSVSFTFGVDDPASSAPPEPSHSIDLPDTLSSADLIVTCTPSTVPLFSGGAVKAGAHLMLIGSYKPHMREVDDEMIKRAGVVLVDSKEACATEAGELIRAEIGEEGMVEIGQAVDSAEAREKVTGSGDVTLYKSVGIGIQDVAIAALILDEAVKAGLGTVIPDYDLEA